MDRGSSREVLIYHDRKCRDDGRQGTLSLGIKASGTVQVRERERDRKTPRTLSAKAARVP